jgi:hypothetical protein
MSPAGTGTHHSHIVNHSRLPEVGDGVRDFALRLLIDRIEYLRGDVYLAGRVGERGIMSNA